MQNVRALAKKRGRDAETERIRAEGLSALGAPEGLAEGTGEWYADLQQAEMERERETRNQGLSEVHPRHPYRS